jgi:hypothetical protein
VERERFVEAGRDGEVQWRTGEGEEAEQAVRCAEQLAGSVSQAKARREAGREHEASLV